MNNKLFSDLKTDEEKSAFFLSGRGYETGVIAPAIQNDVAMAYHRCSEYAKERATTVQIPLAEYEKLKADAEWVASLLTDWKTGKITGDELADKLFDVFASKPAIDAALKQETSND
jgi:hypothetical protein